MNQQRQRLRASPAPLWQRILERHRYKGRLLRPRVPLVLRLRRAGNHHRERRTALPPHVTQYALNLHLQLCWPFVSVQGNTLHNTHLHSNSAHNFLWLMPGRSLSSQSNTQRSALINSYTIALVQPNHLHFESAVFRNAGSLLPVQTRTVVELLRQANATNTLTHVSHNVNQPLSVTNAHATNKSIEVHEARRIFAGMLLQHSNLASHITSKIFASSTLVDRKGNISETPKLAAPRGSLKSQKSLLGTVSTTRDSGRVNDQPAKSDGLTHPLPQAVLTASKSGDRLLRQSPARAQRSAPNSGSKQLKPVTVVEHHREVKSSGPIAPGLAKFHSYRAEHEVLQHTTALATRQINIETPISLLQSTARSALELPTSTRVLLATPPASNKAHGNGPRALTTMLPPLYTQPVTRNFATQPAREETGSQSQERVVRAAPPQANTTIQQPSLDIGRLTDEVYRHIQRKIRVERERRGL